MKRLIGGGPQACVFQLAFCLLLYNMIQVICGYLAEAHDVEPEAVSTKKLFDDVDRQLIAWNVILDPSVTLHYFASPPTPPQLQARLRRLPGRAWSDVWLRSPPQAAHGKSRRQHARTHHSVDRILPAPTRNKPPTTARSP